jgi:hypothetical protein
MFAAILIVATACAGGSVARPTPSPAGSAVPSPSPGAAAPGSARPSSALESGFSLCEQVGAVESRIAALRAVELRLPNRVALDIELGKLQAAFVELAQADLGPFAEQLEGPLTRLAYRLGEVELAVEDFRTNSRPQRAVTHVETDAQTFSEELAAFAILARC